MSSAARRSASAVARAYTWSVSVTLACPNRRCAVFTSTPAATMADAAAEPVRHRGQLVDLEGGAVHQLSGR